MPLVLGLEHSYPWPREGLSSERLSLALASSLVSSTPPLQITKQKFGSLFVAISETMRKIDAFTRCIKYEIGK